jgi:hypothetical protein
MVAAHVNMDVTGTNNVIEDVKRIRSKLRKRVLRRRTEIEKAAMGEYNFMH